MYNEPVEEQQSNARTLMFVKQAFGVPDDVVLRTEVRDIDTNKWSGLVEEQNKTGRQFDVNRWFSVASFDYSPADSGVIQGISTSNPVELSLKLKAPLGNEGTSHNLINFCELAYDLVFKGGSMHYEEQKPGSQSVY